MGMSEALLPEFDHEMQNTRKVLERVPEGKPDYRPHPKSMTLGRLAAHVAEIPRWAGMTLATESLDVNPPGEAPRTPAVMTSRQELLNGFDKMVAESRAAIAGASDAELAKPWTLLAGGRTVLTMPKAAVLRSFVLSHLIHHRAQLGVYLRLNDVAVPSIYGPSADEGAF
jgi:uncharacterized damage-inducible protein DinB